MRTVLRVATDVWRLVSRASDRERGVKTRRADDATRIMLVILSPWIEWPRILTIVQPNTLSRHHERLLERAALSPGM